MNYHLVLVAKVTAEGEVAGLLSSGLLWDRSREALEETYLEYEGEPERSDWQAIFDFTGNWEITPSLADVEQGRNVLHQFIRANVK